MNFKDEIKRRTEIQQAWLDGETIEGGQRVFDSGHDYGAHGWRRIGTPEFEWKMFDYRVKPKVYVKPEDLEVGKTYLDETDGETMKVLEESSDIDRFWCRTVSEDEEVSYILCSLHGIEFSESKFIEVQEDER